MSDEFQAPELPVGALRRGTPTSVTPVVDEGPPAMGARLAVTALVVAFLAVAAGLWATERAIERADRAAGQVATLRAAAQAGLAPAAPPDAPSAATVEDAETWRNDSQRLRVAAWVLASLAMGAVAIALAHERRQRWRIAERSAELERLSGTLIQVNRTKSEFLANVSHELRTPLNAIVGFVDLLQDGVYGPLAPRQQAPVQRLASSAAHLRQLVDQILDLAKISAGRLDVQTEALPLRAFVLDVVTELEPLVQARGLALTIAVPTTLPRVRTDPTHLRQILVNLLGNAIKFTPEGRITLRGAPAARAPLFEGGEGEAPPTLARAASAAWRLLPLPGGRASARGAAGAFAAGAYGATGTTGAGSATGTGGTGGTAAGWVALQVIDTGIGIPAEDQERIFDEFEQVGPRTGDSAVRGTGLGLAISRRLARLLGGDLTVESAPGRGATFTVWLRAE